MTCSMDTSVMAALQPGMLQQLETTKDYTLSHVVKVSCTTAASQGVNGYSTASAEPADASAQSRSTHATTTRHAAADTGNTPTLPPYTDVVAINARGVEVHCLRSTLQQVPGSRLAAMFAPGSSWEAGRDSHGRYYLPYDAHMFSRVVSGLQARHVLGVAAWEVEPLEGLAPPQQEGMVALLSHLGVLHLFDRSQQQQQQEEEEREEMEKEEE